MMRGHPSVYFLFLISFFISRDVFAESYTWENAVSEARRSHPDLVLARERIHESEADRRIASSRFFPQVSADLSAARSKSGSSPEANLYSYGVSGSQLLFDGFKTYSDVQAAVQGIEADRYSYSVVSSDVRLNLRVSYVELLRAQELLRITETIAARRLQSRNLVRLRYEAGREHRGSLLTSEANLAQAEFEVEQARRNLQVSQRRLLTAMGQSHFTAVEAGEALGLGPLSAAPDMEALAEETPFLRQLIVLKEAARWGVQSAKADFFPQIYATASTGRSAAHWPPDRSDWSVGAQLTVPVFEGGNRVAAAAKAGSALGQAAAEEKSGRNGVILTLEETWNFFQDARDNVGVQAKFLEAAREREKIAEAEYSTGLITFNDWIIIEDNLVQAEKSYLDARANALAAEADWRQAKGDTLDEE